MIKIVGLESDFVESANLLENVLPRTEDPEKSCYRKKV